MAAAAVKHVKWYRALQSGTQQRTDAFGFAQHEHICEKHKVVKKSRKSA